MKILYIATSPPIPLTWGDRLRNNLFIEKLSYRGDVDITLLTFYENKLSDKYAASILNNHAIKYDTVKREPLLIRLLQATKYLFHYPLMISVYYSKNIINKIETLLQQNHFDIIFVSSIQLSVNLFSINCHTIPVVVDSIDAKSLYLERVANATNNIFIKLLNTLEYPALRHYEKLVAHKFRAITLISDVDKAYIIKHTSSDNIYTIKNAWSFANINTENNKSETNEIRLIFTGNLDYLPNKDALIHFIKDLFPSINGSGKNIKFIICGPGRIGPKYLHSNRIEYMGNVPVLAEYLIQGDIYISPLRIGTGVKNKIVEAMFYSLPVVCYPVSNEGINARDMKEIMVANTEDEFIEKAMLLINEKEKRIDLGKNAKIFIDHYLKENSVEELYRLFEYFVHEKIS